MTYFFNLLSRAEKQNLYVTWIHCACTCGIANAKCSWGFSCWHNSNTICESKSTWADVFSSWTGNSGPTEHTAQLTTYASKTDKCESGGFMCLILFDNITFEFFGWNLLPFCWTENVFVSVFSSRLVEQLITFDSPIRLANCINLLILAINYYCFCIYFLNVKWWF